METATDILRFYFPNISDESLAFEASFLEMGWLRAAALEPGFEVRHEQDRLAAVEGALRTLWREYNALPLQLRKHDGADGQRRIASLYYGLIGTHPMTANNDALREVFPRKVSGLERMRAALDDGPHIHHTQRTNNAKIHLVGEARDLWKKYKGREAPRSPSGTSDPDRRRESFFEFVSDLIRYADYDWTADNALRVWRERYPD